MFRSSKNSRKSSSSRRPQTRSLRFESLEDRRLKSVNPAAGVGATSIGIASGPTAPGRIVPVAVGSIALTSGTIYVKGGDGQADTVVISIDNRGTASTADDMVKVYLGNINIPQTAEFPVSQVKQLNVQTFAGDDYVDNQTSIPMYADGGAGSDVLLGGSGSDTLFGGSGAGNDYLDGRAGNDMLIAGSGVDMLFGDDGNDYLYGAAGGKDYMFGGNGNDYLYGEGSNGFLFGEAGADQIIDYTGTNKVYQDYGPNGAVVDQPENFQWFDENLLDPTVRSQARLEYRDFLFDRADMLNIYTTVEKDGTVSANEFNDLQKLAQSNLQEPDYVNYLAQRVADGDPANAHYQGAKLGNLKAGSTATQLGDLVGKWWEGTDLPAIGDTDGVTVKYKQVSGTLFNGGAPTYSDIDQGMVADCYFMSSLGEVAKVSPQTITNMFIMNSDGTYTVRFYNNGQEGFVTVNTMLPVQTGNVAYFAGWGFSDLGKNDIYNGGNRLWVALAEKAYVQLNESGWIGQDGTNTYQGIDNGDPAAAYNQITRQSVSDLIINKPSSALITVITQFLSFNEAVMLSTYSDSTKVAMGLVANHTYMLVGYNAANQTVELVNPHNKTDSAGEQIDFWVGWQAIGASFDEISTGFA